MGDEATKFVIQNKYLDVLEKVVKSASEMGYYSHERD